MREIFVSQLVKEVLGPRGGLHEILESNPISEYITGILSPIPEESNLIPVGIDDAATLPIDISTASDEEGNIDEDVEISALLSPALDPKRIPSTMGISFFVRTTTQSIPKIRVCLTWARYYKSVQGKSSWKRNPRHAILDIDLDSDSVTFFDPLGKKIDQQNAEISFHSLSRKKGNDNYFITLYFVNRMKVPKNDQPVEMHHIFQPQIRVRCETGTEIIQDLGKKRSDPEEQKMEFLYRDRPFFARGHLCSTIWESIDPENQSQLEGGLDFPEILNEVPFKWVDSELLSESDRKLFSPPHLRTEYVPMYSVPSPDYNWKKEFGEEPEMRAEMFAELWDPNKLRTELSKISTGYKNWIETMESSLASLDDPQKKISEKIILQCKVVLERMMLGIDILCNGTDEDARLAFCFANKAIDTQSLWTSRKQHLNWRPFQLAFILMSIESIINEKSSYRNVCDLLWVPTGAGKTEAYLALIAFSISYRRRNALKRRSGDKTGAGVSVISRYTLRLLTIQQFRRTLSLITAAEYLRVSNLANKKSIGWRPNGYPTEENILWGSTPFSVGLWVGGGVTPNRMNKIGWGRTEVPGALDILSAKTFGKSSGEPAQILNCPACESLLSIPDRGLQRGDHQLHLVVRLENGQNLSSTIVKMVGKSFRDITVRNATSVQHNNPNFHTISLQLNVSSTLSSKTIDDIWNNEIENFFKNEKLQVYLIPVRPSRPGYFLRHYVTLKRTSKNYDFEIFCPNPKCFLKMPWSGGAPTGSVHGRNPDGNVNVYEPSALKDGNNFVDIPDQFRLQDPVISDRIPIPALTVDEQIYHKVPSVIVATVDKFARLPFEPDSGTIFGNVEFHHAVWGYYRLDEKGHPSPAGKSGANNYQHVYHLDPPNLILQDELHLIDGPLGSLVGIYESAFDFLCKTTNNGIVKYVASTATIRRSEEQVQSVFLRKLQTFPPLGLYASDRFFIRDHESHPLEDKKSGRLYVGICAPGKGPLTPLVRIWSRLAQIAWENRTRQEIDRFWTLTGYFNAVRELAGARALYRQDIKERIDHNFVNPRPLSDDRVIELSSRTPSTDLPEVLDMLGKNYPEAPDGLFTTSIFGTGVDISRIGLMIVNGQPKTTSSYIQSTGRVGRGSGALVVTFFRASRPRDLNHYEFFCRHHRQLQRFVESPTVYPFSPGVVDRALGPVAVAILRNMRNTTTQWKLDASPPLMGIQRNDPQVVNLSQIMEERSENQPKIRKPSKGKTQHNMNSEIDRWQSFASQNNNLKYVEYSFTKLPQLPVVLGDAQHQHAGLPVVYKNAPQSLRDIEETIGVQT
jgi:Helicase conserved C-terminal domain